MKNTACPSPEALRQLVRRQLPAEQARDLEGHLRDCPPCTRFLQTLSAEEQAEAATLAPTGAGSPSIPPRVPAAAANQTFNFLAPAQQPDELGRLGSYRVLKVLGQGGMGVVFLAEDSRLHRSVALKVMLPALAQQPTAKERFLREARAAAALEHDHIVPIYQVDEDRGVPYIAMPLLKGLSLDDWLKQKKQGDHGVPLTLPQVFKIGREIARGLAAAHARGLVHRDIKPANLWLDATTGGRVKILDFGLARATSGEQQLTQSGAIVGTPAYMAPEQAQGQMVDARADLFSLGVVLYRLCTGELPFTGADVVSTLVAVATTTPAPPRALNPELPPALSNLVMQLLEKDPARRVAGAADVVKALQAIERDLGAHKAGDATAVDQARPPSGRGPDRSAARPRRRRLLLTGGAVLVLVLLAVFGGLLVRWATARGDLRIEVDDPSVQVLVKQNGVVVQERTTQRTFTLSAGDGEVEVFDKDGIGPLATEQFTLARGGAATVTVDMNRARFRLPALKLDPGGHTAWIERLQITPDGKQLLSSCAHDPGIRVWDVATGKSRGVLHPPGGESCWFTLSPDGQKLAVSSSCNVGGKVNDIIYVMTLADGQVERALQGHAGGVHGLAFSPDGKRLASGGRDKTIRLWDLATGTAERLFETAGSVHGLAFSPDGSRLANDFVDSDACDLRDLTTGKVVVRLKGGEVPGWCAGHTVVWSPDGSTLATCGRDGLRLWKPDGTLRFHLCQKVETMSVAFSADSSRVLAFLRFAKPALFHNRTGKPAVVFPKSPWPDEPGHIGDGVWWRDGKLAATAGGWNGVYDIFLWNPATGTLLKRLGLHNWLSGPDLQAGWSADGQTVSWRNVDPSVWKGGPTTFHLGELRLGSPLPRDQLRGRVLRQGPISLAQVSANTVQVLKEGKPFTDLQLPGSYRLEQPDAFTLVGKDRAVLGIWSDYVFDTNTGKTLRHYYYGCPVWSLAPSPDGRHVLSLGFDQKLRIFDPNRPGILLMLYVSGQDWVLWTPKENYYAASPGGERLVRWRVGNGIDKEPTFYPAERFRKERYRPDVLKRVLEKGSIKEALAAANAALKPR